MATNNRSSQSEKVDFNHFMFGRPLEEENTGENLDNKETTSDEEFDFIDTTTTIIETYKQLSPYVKEISDMLKKFKP